MKIKKIVLKLGLWFFVLVGIIAVAKLEFMLFLMAAFGAVGIAMLEEGLDKSSEKKGGVKE